MIHQKIEKLLPYIGEDFITYPLWEEGKYIPFVKFWQATDTDLSDLVSRLSKEFLKNGYGLEYISISRYPNQIHDFQIWPKYTDLDNGGYEFVKPDWSIEEMLDLLIEFIKS